MKIALSAETTIDMNKELLAKYDIHTVPFFVLLGTEEIADDDLPPKKIFEYVSNSGKLAKTCAVNESQYETHFNALLASHDTIVHISLSSEMSSAFSNAQRVAKQINESAKKEKVFVLDSRSLSTGIALLALYARKLIDGGLSANIVMQKLAERVPHVQASFVLKRVDYLYKGGRCGYLQMLGANLLRLRPQIIVENGKMKPGAKYRGSFDVVTGKYVLDTLDKFNNPDLSQVFITYTTATDTVIDNIKEMLTKRGFKNILVTNANATVSSHCGEDCLGILYINDGESIS